MNDLRLISRALSEPLMMRAGEADMMYRLAVAANRAEMGGRSLEHIKAVAWARAQQARSRDMAPMKMLGALAADEVAVDGGNWPVYMRFGSVAVIPVLGTLDRTAADVTDSGGNRFGTAYSDVSAGLARAKADPNVKGVLMWVDSPGGAAVGNAQVAAEVRAVGKPVGTFADGLAASAGYYIGSQADRGLLMVTPDAFVGSIGTVMYHVDESAALAEQGVKVTAIESTPTKTVGAGFKPLSESDKAILQAEVDVLGGQFRAAVGAARGVSAETVKGWADQQRGFIGADAVAAGLADSVVGTLEDAVAVMRAKVGGGSAGSGGGLNKQTKTTRAGGAAPALKHTVRTGRSGRMELSELMAMEGGSALAELLRRQGAESAAPKPATIDELEGAFPDNAAYVLTALKGGMTLDQAKAGRADALAAELKAERAKAAELAGQAAALKDIRVKAGSPGVEAVKGGGGGGTGGGENSEKGTAEAFRARFESIRAEKKVPRARAVFLAKQQDAAGWQAWHKAGGDSFRENVD